MSNKKNIAKESVKEKADRIRSELAVILDDDLVFAEAFTFSERFESLAAFISRASKDAQEDLPF